MSIITRLVPKAGGASIFRAGDTLSTEVLNCFQTLTPWASLEIPVAHLHVAAAAPGKSCLFCPEGDCLHHSLPGLAIPMRAFLFLLTQDFHMGYKPDLHMGYQPEPVTP